MVWTIEFVLNGTSDLVGQTVSDAPEEGSLVTLESTLHPGTYTVIRCHRIYTGAGGVKPQEVKPAHLHVIVEPYAR